LKKLIVITGPTASGKTSVSITLALHYQSEILNADSRQFYKGLDIGTAKPLPEERKRVRHHFIDSLDISEKYNIGKFEHEALEKIRTLFLQMDTLFITGGSGLYIDAVIKGMDEMPQGSEPIRAELTRLLNTEGIQSLQARLKVADPEYYDKADIHNPHRLIRALEVNIITGKKMAELQSGNKKQRDFSVRKIGLLTDRDELYDLINKRVDAMIARGLLEEVKSMLPYRKENALQTVGYKEIFDYFDNLLSLEEAINKIKQNTRNYAKRQMTWFRKDPEIKWFYPGETEAMIRYIDS
jgi:tRNA dimethylallyltransferase